MSELRNTARRLAEACVRHGGGDFVSSYAVELIHTELNRLASELEAAKAEASRYKNACIKQNHEIEQTLGKVLGYPWFKDDPVNFPDSAEEHGVCVGDHVAESLADEAAAAIVKWKGLYEKAWAECEEWRYKEREDFDSDEKWNAFVCRRDKAVEAHDAARREAGLDKPEPAPKD